MPEFLYNKAREMTFIRYKKFKNNVYAYEVTASWDAKLGQSRSKSKYIGKVDAITKKLIPKVKIPKESEKHILDFGDGFLLYELLKQQALYPILKNHLFIKQPLLEPLIIYCLSNKFSVETCKHWVNGNIIRIFFQNPDLSPAKINQLLLFLAESEIQELFFTEYLRATKSSEIQDGLKNLTIYTIYTNSSVNINNVSQNIKSLAVINNTNKQPLYFYLLSEDTQIIDELIAIITDLEKYKETSNELIVLDKSSFSNNNIKTLYDNKINFLIKLPRDRILFKYILLEEINSDNIKNLESSKYARTFNNKIFFIKEATVKLFDHQAYAYIILDPERKAKEIAQFIGTYSEELASQDKKQSKFIYNSCGIFILICSKLIKTKEVLLYYKAKQALKQKFYLNEGDSISFPLPLFQENKEDLKGYLFLNFLSQILKNQIQEKYSKTTNLEDNLAILRALKCKVYENIIIPYNPTDEQKDTLERYKISLPISVDV